MTKDPIWISRKSDKNSADFWPTPEWVTKALLDNEVLEGKVWEPACGDGAMARVISDFGYDVYASDKEDRGYGEVKDFLSRLREYADCIVTNPPFNLAAGFVMEALSSAECKVCMLLPLSFLEGAKRHDRLFSIYPPDRVWVFSERVTFTAPGVTRKVSGTRPMAWFVWDFNSRTSPQVTQIKWLRGYKPVDRKRRKAHTDNVDKQEV
jgi:hypothetical protein